MVATAAVGGAFKDDEQAGNGPVQVFYLAAPPMSLAEAKVRLLLKKKVDMIFPNDTPLKEVIEHIATATRDEIDFPNGIQIYFEPMGLNNADKTMDSPITINLKGLTLDTTLPLLLGQLGLAYRVDKGGFLFVSSPDDSGALPVEPEHEILRNLATLRDEVRALREEVRASRSGSGAMPSSALRLPDGVQGHGEISGFFTYTPRRFRVAR